MKKYCVYGYIFVEADNEEEAEKEFWKTLRTTRTQDRGVDGIDSVELMER